MPSHHAAVIDKSHEFFMSQVIDPRIIVTKRLLQISLIRMMLMMKQS